MTDYGSQFDLPIAFDQETPRMTLGQWVSDAGIGQFRTAETEKYAHVTFFFNGGREPPYPGEERLLIPSPKVASYDLQPEMSAPAVADAVIGAMESGKYGLVIVNFANGDMVGHTAVRKEVWAGHRQLRQRRHGRPHRRPKGDSRGGQGARPRGRPCARRRRRVRLFGGADRRPRQLRADGRPG
jgi:2,3-bisphosphoglycerate-independent phosphoglycerate mutase